MKKSLDKNSAQSILNYWLDIEALTPPFIDKDSIKESGKYKRIEVTKNSGVIDWSFGKQNPQEREAVINIIRVGLFKTNMATMDIAKALGVDDDEIVDEKPIGKDGFLAVFAIDSEGRIIPSSLMITLFAMRFETLTKGIMTKSYYEMRQARIIESFDDKFVDKLAPPMDAKKLFEVSEWIIKVLASHPTLLATTSNAPFAVIEQNIKYNEDDDHVGILDSFLFDDIARVYDAVNNGKYDDALAHYLNHKDLHNTDRHDVDHKEVMETLTSISKIPLGKWPSRGKNGHPLVFRQQMAVNASMAMSEGGLFSVNGPPGTGKTTLLRDIIAAVFVNRAATMSKFSHPNDAFKEEFSIMAGRRVISAWKLDERLADYGIVVASSNNAAVENITKELPDANSIADSIRKNPVNWNRLDFFREVAGSIAPEGQKVWGLASAALGNANNCNLFSKKYWPAYDTSQTVTIENAEILNMDEPKKSSNGALYVSAFVKVDQERYSIKAFGKPAEDLATLYPQFKGKIVTLIGTFEENTNKSANQERVETRKKLTVKEVNSENSKSSGIRDIIMGPCAQLDWSSTVKTFQKAQEQVSKLLEATHILANNTDEVNAENTVKQASDTVSLNKALASKTEEDLNLAKNKHITIEEERKIVLQRSSIVMADKPNILSRIFHTKNAVDWKSRISSIGIEVESIEKFFKESEKNVSKTKDNLKDIESARQASRKTYNDARRQLEAIQNKINVSKLQFKKLPLSFESACLMEREEREQVAVWVSEELDIAREELFIAAVEVHLAFLGGAKKKVIDNLRVFVDILRGARDLEEVRPKIAKHLWNTFFMTVPVISSTFASISRMFGNDFGPGDIGWLLIDEAGQAIPQAAVGAIWRAKRAIVVGDPKQVEPVVTIPEQVSAHLFEKHKVSNSNFDVRLGSVQTVADRVNPFGAFLGEDRKWVGSPLRVHRRCSDPMFSISNHISYAGSMVLGKPALDTSGWRGDIPDYGPGGHPSAWFDVKTPGEPGSNLVKGQVTYAFRMLLKMVEQTDIANNVLDKNGKSVSHRFLGKDGMPEVFIISPFRSMATAVRQMLRDNFPRFKKFNISKETLEAWGKSHIGTVHTFQGKESETVIIVLGGNSAKPGGVSWAGNTSNILNVAITRAKSSVYIIGDVSLWSTTSPFREAAKQLETISIPTFAVLVPDIERVERINTLDGHLALLSGAFKTAKQTVVISSPFLTDNALEDKRCNIPILIKEAISRGIKVVIYVDPALNESESKKPRFLRAVEILKASGANLVFANKVHAKTLCVDDTSIVEGSFNWLSATRDPESKFQRLEASFRYSGIDAGNFIANAISLLDATVRI